MVNASWGVDGLMTRRPGVCAKYASGDSEWCSAEPIPPPKGTRIVMGSVTAPSVRACIRDTWLTIWSNAG